VETREDPVPPDRAGENISVDVRATPSRDTEADSGATGEPALTGSETGSVQVTPERPVGGAHEEYAEHSRAGITYIYVTDNRRNDGVYVEGDLHSKKFAARDVTTTARGDNRERTRQLSVVAVARKDQEKLLKVVLEVGHRERALEVLSDHRFVVLRGPAGVGKSTAALSLLGLEQQILGIDPSLTARELVEFKRCFPFGPGRRFLIEALSPATAAQISSFVARSLSRDLGDQDDYLVMTLDERAILSADVSPYVVEWRERPETEALLRNHLRHYLGQDDVAGVEAGYDLRELHVHLAQRPLRDVDEVARATVRAFAAGLSITALLDETGFGARAQVAEWFTIERTAEEIGFLLAVTVFGGCDYGTVSQCGRQLNSVIARRNRSRKSDRRVDLLRTRSDRLRGSMAVLDPGFVETEFGRSPVDTVRLQSRWHVQAVLDVVWHEYDVIADSLIEWLHAFGDNADPGVRLRAAIASGYLSQFDFAQVRRRLLLPWALGTTESSRAAADALGQAAHSDTTAPLVLSLLEVWAADPTVYDLWWTAAVAYGGEVGVCFPSTAMGRLLSILVSTDARAQSVVAESAVRLVQGGGRFDRGIASHVLSHLCAWLTSEPSAVFTAHKAYWELLRRAADSEWPSSREYLTLLVSDPLRDASGRLLRSVLSDRSFREASLDALESILRIVESDESTTDLLGGLFVEVASGLGSSQKDADRLVAYLDRWAGASAPVPSAHHFAALVRGAVDRDDL
jgi:hypothetical protein